MNQLNNKLKKMWPVLVLIVLLILALFIIFLNSTKEEVNKNNIVDEPFVQCVSENKIISSDTKTAEIDEDNFPKKLCSGEIQDEIEEIKKTYYFLINDREYDTRINAETICEDWDVNCHDRSFDLNEENIQQEIKENKYNLINGCLYNDGIRALDFDLRAYYQTNFFGQDLGPKFGVGLTAGTFQATYEWFRFEHDNKLFIFLKNTAGCGGCAFNGHYLEIDLESGKITGKYQDGLYSYFNTILSPDKKRAITVSWDDEDYNTELYLYDFTDFSKKLIFTIPEDRSILDIEYARAQRDDAITWLNNNTISLQLFEKNGGDVVGEKDGVKYELNQDGKLEPIKSGAPIEIKVIK
ncbi:MAG TPA: hypothetical protein VFD51_03105 [Patescibacteria group bacterium]|nr:hypothetical protein [Patescibacteria group bacterium]